MRRWTIVLTALLVAVGLTLGLAACGDDDDGGSADTAASTAAAADLGLLEPGKLQVASDIPYAPFEFTEPGSTEAIGFDVDLVKAVAATPGIGITDVEFIKQPFDTIIVSIAQGRFDMSASSFSITPERAKQIDFSDGYFTATQSVMVKTGSDIQSIDDLEGRRIGVQRGTTGADLAATVKGAEVLRYEIIDDAFNALAADRVDAVINDYAVSAYAAERRDDFEIVDRNPTVENYGLVFPKDNPALRDAFNAGLAEIRANGTYDEIFRKWFGEDPPAPGEDPLAD
ncbi:MAG TPA: basic amino acid ABC transporter substrate-binding protein [Miltoncostaeaceae bacterium]|jgi:polar amino acid transport system substrate-binding protein|nr:basic amino acid ABC transporter substrate-binding protein [Miltoncostaeaceae bacterium]